MITTRTESDIRNGTGSKTNSVSLLNGVRSSVIASLHLDQKLGLNRFARLFDLYCIFRFGTPQNFHLHKKKNSFCLIRTTFQFSSFQPIKDTKLSELFFGLIERNNKRDYLHVDFNSSKKSISEQCGYS